MKKPKTHAEIPKVDFFPSTPPGGAPSMPHPPPPEHDIFMLLGQEAYDDHVLRSHRPKITLDEESTYAAVFAFSGAAIGSWISRNQGTVRALMTKLPDAAELAKLFVAMGVLSGPGPVAAKTAKVKRAAAKKKPLAKKRREPRATKPWRDAVTPKSPSKTANGSPERPEGP